MPVLSSAAFPDLFNSSRATILTGEDFVANFAQRVNYPMGKLMAGRSPLDAVRGGPSIIETVMTNDTGRFTGYNAGDRATISSTRTTKQLAFEWALYRSEITWTDTEYNANTSNGNKARVKRFAKIKEMGRVTTHVNGLDRLCFAVPNYDTMQGTVPAGGTRVANSIPVFISEDASRKRPPSSVWNSNNVAGLDATDSTLGWDNKRQSYTAASPTDLEVGLLPAWDLLMLELEYQKAANAGGAGFITTGPSDLVCFTNKYGIALMKRCSRAGNDRWENPADGSRPNPKFDGVDFVNCPQLETELLSQTGSTYDGTAYPATKPRFFVVNQQTLRPVFMEGELMEALPVARDNVNYPDTSVVWTKSSLNFVCNDRSKNGIVFTQ